MLFSASLISLSSVNPTDIIEIRAQPFSNFDLRDPSRIRFGDLIFRGGLKLSSSYDHFGGISALHIRRDGAWFLAATDRGYWLHGRIVYDDGQPTGIADAEMKPFLGPEGKPEARWDVESIALDGSILYAGVERINSIFRFDYGRPGLLARGRPLAVPSAIKKWPRNQSLEAMVFVPKGHWLEGTLIVLSERALDESGNAQALLIGGPMPGIFAVKRSGGYDISDAALLPCGDILLLERKYSFERHSSMRIRRIALQTIKPGVVADGPVLIEADKNFQIDNMEAISVHRNSSGEIIFTLMSDDNFSSAQRTIMLQFALIQI
jgi:hypothetical protein